MPLAVSVLLLVLGLPALAIGIVWLRLRSKEKKKTAQYWAIQKSFTAAGAEPLGEGVYRWGGRYGKMSISTNPLFSKMFTVRLAGYSDTIHEVELRRGKPVPAGFEKLAPLLQRWESAGKMFIEVYCAGVTDRTDLADDLKQVMELSRLPLSKTWRGGTFTYREGFESDVPQWHWRHDLRPKLPKDVKRWCVSYWQGSPLLNPVLARLFTQLVPASRPFYMSDTEDLSFLERGFERRDIACWGAMVELMKPEMAVAADLHTDGEFFGGLLVARDLPPGFEIEGMPKRLFHEAALKVLRKCDFYVRRLYDDECSWFSGEYEIISAYPIDVRGTLDRIAAEMGAEVMEIDRRFHKRIVVPLNW